MDERAGRVFSIAAENAPVPGCTTSKAIEGEGGARVTYFSLAARTDISAESYTYRKLLAVNGGSMQVYTTDGRTWEVPQGALVCAPANVPVGMRTEKGCVYTEISLKEDATMNEALKAGEVLKLADLLPYQDGKIVNMDLAHNDSMKLALMSFDAGTGLDEHAAPGEALVFALDGEGVIGYEGEEHPIKAGENFKFDKGGKHFVRADKRFKMALLLLLK